MKHYIVFGRKGQYIVNAESRPHAIRLVAEYTDTSGDCFGADQWQANPLSAYCPQTRKELIVESVSI